MLRLKGWSLIRQHVNKAVTTIHLISTANLVARMRFKIHEQGKHVYANLALRKLWRQDTISNSNAKSVLVQLTLLRTTCNAYHVKVSPEMVFANVQT